MEKYQPKPDELKWAEYFHPIVKRLANRVPAAYKLWLNGPLLTSIVSRETLWTTSKLYVADNGSGIGRTDGTGDHGHGRGIWQIDDRAHGKWIAASADWKDAYKGGCYVIDTVLIPAYVYLLRQFSGQPIHKLAAGAVAAYNCGAGNVFKCWKAGTHEDTRTAGNDYSRDVLNRQNTFWGDWYQSMTAKEATNGNPDH